MRPGLMMRGRVVMAPAFCDTTDRNRQCDPVFIRQCRVYVNDKYEPDVIAYDEDGHTALIQRRTIHNDRLPTQLLTGDIRVTVRP